MPTKCEHRWIGLGAGVRCMRCGLEFTTAEYRVYLAAAEKPKRTAGHRRKPQEKRSDEAGENPNAKEADAQ